MQKTQQRVGIIGGMSWQSTALYYSLLNQQIHDRLGGLHSADIIVHSVDFHQISELQHNQQWDELSRMMIDSARLLENAGATAIAIATNTMHKVAPDVAAAISIPLLNIISATAQHCRADQLQHVGLLGTRFTMHDPFYRDGLQQHGLQVTTPDTAAQHTIHQIIYEELCQGTVTDAAQQQFLAIMKDMTEHGVQGFILGCTEIGLLINSHITRHTLVDTTQVHTRHIVRHLLGQH
ncbi:amino acid racemase [Salinimonas marina]|uniref:Amino acid racemase n=1 Tax=Salinimonas marina TaxID=2785918 RepID=A0A7S9HCC0_9ALTE|nr:amino acid racemase [Salinimonas marina]QPG05121.1 amino acid racemase [Salinimonas marina]